MCYASVAGLKGFRGGGGAEGGVHASVTGGAAGIVKYADALVGEESALAKGFTGYRQTGDAGLFLGFFFVCFILFFPSFAFVF
jgi:hypothetical protein